ncbi:hypothetical protein ACS7SF_05675 [Ralstonia sp. 25C]|uniref:hypothetical protein n=1 Tax=Ralstonia sp. 25C TaxID=3447363 RepID=UPI003F753F35
MNVEKEHFIDCSDPDADGMYDYYYEYDVYEFQDGGMSYVVRCYTDEPLQASFMGVRPTGKEGDEWGFLQLSDMQTDLFRQVVSYLTDAGKRDITFLSEEGYQAIPSLPKSV